MEHNKLKLEDCCLTVEQAKELKVLGIDMDNPLFEYIQLVSDKQYIEEPIEKRVLGKPFLYNNTLSTLVVGGNEMYELITPTLTNSEMLEMLPKEITPIEMVRQEERSRAAILYGKLISKMYPEGIVNRLSENFRELLDKESIDLDKKD